MTGITKSSTTVKRVKGEQFNLQVVLSVLNVQELFYQVAIIRSYCIYCTVYVCHYLFYVCICIYCILYSQFSAHALFLLLARYVPNVAKEEL